MGEADNQINLRARLESLQCHFTWDELTNETKPKTVQESLENIGIDEGNCWLPHIYNLQGYLYHRLGSDEKALVFLQRATEDFRRRLPGEEGPWLMVNYGNLAWLHYRMGQQAESERYLLLAEDLSRRHPMIQEELHPEVAAEKAWTLMVLVSDHLKTVEELFRAAIEREPERVEWKTSRVLALIRAEKHEWPLKEETWGRLQRAREEDPENLCIAVKLLYYRAKRRENVAEEAWELAQKVLRNPVSSYSGLKQMLRLFSYYISRDEAVNLAEEALSQHPGEHYLKWCVALCYYWMITNRQDPVAPSMMDRAISLHRELIEQYPGTCLIEEIHLADIYVHKDAGEAERMYQQLLAKTEDPAHQQVLFNHYGRHLQHVRKDISGSFSYHLRAAKMEPQGYYRNHSIKVLKKARKSNWNMTPEIISFLDNLPEDEQ